MAESVPNLRLLDRPGPTRELDLASELFHRINRVIPQTQSVLSVPPDCLVRDAVATMRHHGYSQVPVVQDGEVLGVFSYRAIAQGVTAASLDDWIRQKCAPGDLRVDDFLEKFEFARVTDEMTQVFAAMDRDNGVLIGTPERLLGVLTPMDFLKYLYRVASPYVMVSEIELALRALIRTVMNGEQIAQAAKRCLRGEYGGEDKVPVSLEEMSFDNYRILITHGDAWPGFDPVFGGTRPRTNAKLREIGTIRNDLFHFRREITLRESEALSSHRDWLLAKVKQAESRLKRTV